MVARYLRVRVVLHEQHDDSEHSHGDEKHANDCYAASIKADEPAPANAWWGTPAIWSFLLRPHDLYVLRVER
jgi:hypothetical protein